MLAPLEDGAPAVDLDRGERVTLWRHRRLVPEGVEVVGDWWVSTSLTEARVRERVAPAEPEVLWDWPCAMSEEEPNALRWRGRSRWKTVARPIVMAVLTLALVPIGMAASPPPPDYAQEVHAPPQLEAWIERVRSAPEVQACLETYRQKVHWKEVAYPALLVVEGRGASTVRPVVEVRSGHPALTACLVSAAREVELPRGTYTVSVPVGEEALP